MRFVRRLVPKSRRWVESLLAPAADPRRTYADALERRQEYLGQVREARARIAAARERLKATIAAARRQLASLEERAAREDGASTSRFVLPVRQRTEQEIQVLASELRALEQDEDGLLLVEQRLVAEIDALGARREILAVRNSTARAQVRLREALSEISQERDGLDLALERVEQSESRATELEELLGMGWSRQGGLPVVEEAQRLALRFSSEAGNEEVAAFTEQLRHGLRSVQLLVQEYEQLMPALEKRGQSEPISVAYVPVLAEETFRQGIQALQHALELARTLRAPGARELAEEIAALEQELDAARASDDKAARVQGLRDSLAVLQEQREALDRYRAHIDRLIRQAERCTTALRQARTDLASISASTAEASVSDVTATLLKTLRQAKEVQEEFITSLTD